MSMINEKEIMMSSEEIRQAVTATRARVLKVSLEDKIKMNCSHRNQNGTGKLAVVPRVIKVTNGQGGFTEKKVLQCSICGSIIEQITEAEYRQIMESVPAVMTKVINYVKTFDRKWSEDERQFLVLAQFCTMNLLMLFESTITEARKSKNKDNNQGPRKMVTSGSIFGSRY